MAITIENIMNSSLGETSSEIRASFKKTVLVKQYETEVIELETVLKVDKQLSAAERMFISALLSLQLEYDAYTQLVFKGYVTKTQYDERKKELTAMINALKDKLEVETNMSLDKYIGVNTSETGE